MFSFQKWQCITEKSYPEAVRGKKIKIFTKKILKQYKVIKMHSIFHCKEKIYMDFDLTVSLFFIISFQRKVFWHICDHFLEWSQMSNILVSSRSYLYPHSNHATDDTPKKLCMLKTIWNYLRFWRQSCTKQWNKQNCCFLDVSIFI